MIDESTEVALSNFAPSVSSQIKCGMILAAGRGTRLGALGRQTPKALLEVGGEALVDQALAGLAAANVKEVVINASHLKNQIEAHLKKTIKTPTVQLSLEEEPLETGGGVLKALPLLDRAPFFAINVDTWWARTLASGLEALKQAWRPETMDALLLVLPTVRATEYVGRGDFMMDGIGRLTRKNESETVPFLFTGAQILHPRAFADPPDGAFSLNEIYDRAASSGRLFGVSHWGRWQDVGTPTRLAQARAMADDYRQASLL